MKTALQTGLIIALWMTFASTALSNPSQDSEVADEESQVDPLPLATVLLQDGFPDRAAQVLGAVNEADSELDTVRYFNLSGIAAQRLEQYEKAIRFYRGAIAAAAAPPVIREDGSVVNRSDLNPSTFLLMGQACFQIQQYEDALGAFEQATESMELPVEVILMQGQAQWKLERPREAWDTIGEGRKRFPDNRELHKTAIFLLTDLKLYRQALEEGQHLLDESSRSSAQISENEALMIGESMRKSGALESASVFLEEARLQVGDTENMIRMLGQIYMEQDRVFMAALLFEEQARQNPDFLLDAAELYRQAGNHTRALYLNERIPNQKDKMRQRMGILIDLERYEEVSKMRPRLKRLGLLDDDQLLYAMAYSAFQSGEFDKAEDLLKTINDPHIFEMSVGLREAIMNCRQEGWLCN